MPARVEAPFLPERLRELAARASKSGREVFSPFLTPPEAQAALAAAKGQGAEITLFGGYPEAERQMAAFYPMDGACGPFPIAALEISWPKQDAPSHRDLLGSVMGLGIQRQTLGDIVLLPDRAFAFVQESIATFVADGWVQAGRTRLQAERAEACPELAQAEGIQVHDTVASLRLDAVVSSGLNLSRTKAAELIQSGHVKLRHVQVLRGDARVENGDMISVRGLGRLQVTQVGTPTRKGRLPITVTRYGALKSR